MKKIARIIAMLLVLVMLAGSFTSCFTMSFIQEGMGIKDVLSEPLGILFFPITILVVVIGGFVLMGALDIVTSPIQIIVYNVNKVRTERRTILFNETDTFGASNTSTVMLNDPVVLAFTSMSEEEFNSSIEKLASVSEIYNSSLVSFYNSMSEDEISALTERMYSMSEEEAVSLLRSFLSLSEDEIDSMIKSLFSTIETKYAVLARRRVT